MALNEYIQSLAQKWLDGSISPEEEKVFAEWYNQFDDEGVLIVHRDFAADKQELKQSIAGLLNKRIGEGILAEPERSMAGVHSIYRKWPRLAAAVLVGALLISGGYLYYALSKKTVKVQAIPLAKVIPPGKNGASLTLSDGKQIVLDSLKSGLIATQQGAKVALEDGQVKYNKDKVQGGEIAYNTMSTPRGRQYQLTLSDGTKVWLNASSSVKFPTAFTGPQRKVFITGEVYFEVAKDKAKPFIVNAGKDISIEVLGTHFNINAYPDEDNISATLLEGSIKTTMGKQAALLKPGQQAQLGEQKIKVVDHVDLDMIVSWKTNTFLFNNTDIYEALRQLSRWYDIDVAYEKNAPDIIVGGKIKKNLTLSEALALWQKMGLNFEIKDNKLIVLP